MQARQQIKALLLLAALLLAPSAASAQGCGSNNPNCIVPTVPTCVQDNRAASTTYVHNCITAGAAAGPLGAVQFNSGGVFGGDSGFTYAGAGGTITLNGGQLDFGVSNAGSWTLNTTANTNFLPIARVTAPNLGTTRRASLDMATGGDGISVTAFYNANGSASNAWEIFGFGDALPAIRATRGGVTSIANGQTPTSPSALQVYNTIDSASAPNNYERGTFDWTTSSGTLTIGTQQNGTGQARNVALISAGTEAFRLDTSQRVLITQPGGAGPIGNINNEPFQIVGKNSGANAGAGVGLYGYGVSDDNGSVNFYYTNSATNAATQGAVSGGFDLGTIFFNGSDGTAFRGCGSIHATAEATFSNGSAPTRLVFFNCASGSIASTERLRLDSAGRANFNSSGANFGNLTGNAVEIIDHNGGNFAVFGNTGSSNTPNITFFNTQGANPTVQTAMNSGASLGSLNWDGSDGTAFRGSSFVTGVADAAFAGGSAPGRVVIGTTPSGSTSAIERVRVDSKGHVNYTTPAPTNSACTGFALGTGSSDTAGRVTFTSATSCAISFGTAFTNAPFCTVTPGSAASTVEATTTTAVLTATFGTAQTAMFYECFGS